MGSENVEGTVEKVNDDSKSAVFGKTAVGQLDSDRDVYNIQGRIEEFYIDKPVTIRVDGEEISGEEFIRRFIKCAEVEQTGSTGGSTPVVEGSGDGISPRTDYSPFDQYYVSPDGNYDASGTQDDPWNVSAAVDKAGPGDVVNFLDGTYSNSISVPSGESGNPVVFKAANRYQASIQNSNSYGFDVSGSHLHVVGFEVRPDGAQLFEIKGADNVVFRDNHMSNKGSGQTPAYITNSSNIWFRNNIIREGKNYDNIRMEGNTRMVFEGNFLGRGAHAPFGLYDAGDGDANENSQIVIRGNVFAGVTSRGFEIMRDNNVIFEDNVVTNGFIGPRSGGASNKFTVEDGIFRFNRIFRNHGSGIAIGTYLDNMVSDGTRYYNNVWDKNGGEEFEDLKNVGVKIESYSNHNQVKNTKFVNNVFSRGGSAEAYVRDLDDGSRVEFSNNNFHNPSGTPQVRRASWQSPEYMSVSDAESRVPSKWYENLKESPDFVDGLFDHRLSSSSPLRDAGTNLTRAQDSGPGNQIQVLDPYFFFDGYGISDQKGDIIQVGNQTARIQNIEGNKLELNTEIDWEEGDPVGLPWGGSNPDIGAFESGNRKQVIVQRSAFSASTGDQVTFGADLRGISDPQEVCWQFGDGEGTCGSPVDHQFSDPGDYGVRVRVVDGDGNVHWGTDYILISSSSVDPTSKEYNKNMTSDLICGGGSLYKGNEGWECS